MKILQINTVYKKGSTGKIAKALHDVGVEHGHQCLAAHRYHEEQYEDVIAVSSWLDCHIHNRLARYTRLQGTYSYIKTMFFLRKVKRFSPDIIHLHNLHGSFINLKLLFHYIKKHHVSVVWTLHDCWSFTGYCPHFTVEKCDQWKTKCHQCPQKTFFSIGNGPRRMYGLKKRWFTNIERMTLVTPSHWLAALVKQSFLKDYPVQVIHNGINLEVFKPTQGDFRKKHMISNSKAMILGVSFGWGYRKGLDVFVELSKRLDQEKFQIILVGTDESVDANLPSNIISVHRTGNQIELAEIYTAADVFVNPTREDTFPTVNIEALACGTPVLTFRTGGSPESIDETCGSVVDCNDVDALEQELVRICTDKPYSIEKCIDAAKKFDMNDRFEEYMNLYENIGN